MAPRKQKKTKAASASTATAEELEPIPPPTTSGRVRTYTKKQKAMVVTTVAQDNVTKKRAFTAALRAEQDLEEARGFRQDRDDGAGASGDEYSDGPESEEGFFSAITIPPPIRQSVTHDGRVLVHRVSTQKDPTEVVSSRSQVNGPRPGLIRRVTGASRPTQPIMMPSQINNEFQVPIGQHSRTPTIPNRRHEQDIAVSGHAQRRPLPPQRHDQHQTALYDENFDPVPLEAVHAHYEDFEDPEHVGPKETPGRLSSVLGVRKERPTSISPSSTVPIKLARLNNLGSRGRLRASDFDDFTKVVIEDSISNYRAKISTINPYPNHLEDRDCAAAAWVKACTSRNVQMDFDKDIMKLITARASQIRGQLKTISRPIVETMYGLGSENSKRVIRDKVEDLLERFNFVYKNSADRKGIFRHPAIQSIINKMWYKNKNDDGLRHLEYSTGGTPLVLQAFVLTSIECCLDELQTGEHQDVPFSATTYNPKFVRHLKRLKDFEANTADANIIPRLRMHMLRCARKHAGIDSTTTTTTSDAHLEQGDFDAAKEEWENLELSDGED